MAALTRTPAELAEALRSSSNDIAKGDYVDTPENRALWSEIYGQAADVLEALRDPVDEAVEFRITDPAYALAEAYIRSGIRGALAGWRAR